MWSDNLGPPPTKDKRDSRPIFVVGECPLTVEGIEQGVQELRR